MHQDEQMKLDQSQTVRNTGNVFTFAISIPCRNGYWMEYMINNSNPGVIFHRKQKNYMWQKIILIQEEIKLWKVP
jgi:hypothetical protein